MYQNDKQGSTDNLVYRNKNKKISYSTTKTTDPEIRMQKMNGGATQSKNRRLLGRDELKNAMFAANQIF